MKFCNAYLASATPYSQSAPFQTEKGAKETWEAFELRAWREHLHLNEHGNVIAPAMSFKQAVDRAASMLGIQIPGRGKATYTKHFLSGCLVEHDIELTLNGKPIKGEHAIEQKIYANADGKRGSGKRVWRKYPVIPKWEGIARFVLVDEQLTEDVFERCLREAGQYVGIGRWRAEVGGLNGRFQVLKLNWE